MESGIPKINRNTFCHFNFQDMFIITYRKFFYIFSALLTLGALFAFIAFGIKPSIEFTGGSLLEIAYEKDAPSVSAIQDALKSVSLKDLTIQPTEDKKFLLRFEPVDEKTHQEILSLLKDGKEARFESIGPVIGEELRRKSLFALIFSIIAVFIYILFAFRKVGGRLRPWKMSAATILALIHDVAITVGGFVLFSHYVGLEAGEAFVAATLTVWGYSVHDTIVVFDRLRENIQKEPKKALGELAGASISQTIGRSINTSLAVFILVLFLYVLGPSSLAGFTMPLLIGVVIGTYSSICIATPLLLESKTRHG